MSNCFGPWATAINTGSNPQLSRFWRRRLARLPAASRSRATLSKAAVVGLVLAALAVGAIPTLHGWAVSAERRYANPVEECLRPPAAPQNVSASAKPDDKTPRETRIYAVADVLAKIQQQRGLSPRESQAFLQDYLKLSFPQVEVDFQRGQIRAMLSTSEQLANSRGLSEAEKKQFLEGVARALEDQRYHPAPPGMTWERERLSVQTTAAGQQRVAESLRILRQFGSADIKVHVRFVTLPSVEIDRAGLHWAFLPTEPRADDIASPSMATATSVLSGLPGRGAALEANWAECAVEKRIPMLHAILDDARMAQVNQQWSGSREVNVLQAPAVTLYNGQSAVVSDLSQTPFVVAVEDNRPGEVRQPQIRIVSEGTIVGVRPVFNGGGKVRADFNVAFSKIRGVETITAQAGGGRDPITLQVPEVATESLKGGLELPLAKWLVLGPLHSPDANGKAGARLLVIMRFDTIKHIDLDPPKRIPE